MGGAIPLFLPPTTTLPVAASVTPTPTIPMLVTQTTDALSTLDRPLSLNGTLIGMLENGTLVVQTSKGIAQLALLKTQGETLKLIQDFLSATSGTKPAVEIVLQAGAPPKQALLILPQSEAQKIAQKMAAPAAGMAAPLATPKQERAFQKGHALTVTILPDEVERESISAAPTQTTPLFKPEKAQTHIPRFIERALGTLSEKLTAAKGQVPAAETAPKQAASVTTQTSAPSTATSAPQTVPQTVRLRLDQVLPPDAPWPDDILPTQIKATVISKSHSGNVLMESAGKTIFVHQKGTLSDGAKIVGTPLADADYPVTPLPLSADRDFVPLREMVAALAGADPQAAAHFLQTQLPAPANNFGGTLLFLLSALQNGKMDEWLGEPLLAKLEKSGNINLAGDLLTKLDDTMSQTARDATVGEWRTYPLPLHNGTAFEMLRLYVHHDQGHQGGGAATQDKYKRTRFVITMNMSRLGSMQLDGLSQQKRLDLVVRSEAPLPETLTHELHASTLKTLEATGLTGSLVFQTGRQNWLIFCPDKQKDWVT
ncbi:MAG TPA: hypothetical protein DCY07_04440 [Rhodospirillaceae bacterium]|nr:hypothetical protein [Rhodospirillaceae bacterium]